MSRESGSVRNVFVDTAWCQITQDGVFMLTAVRTYSLLNFLVMLLDL